MVVRADVSSYLRKCQVAIVYTDIYVQATIDAIAEPRRREILCLVRDRELAAGRIAAHFDVTRQAVSQHLRVLHEAGLVSERREGTRRIYRARPEGLAELRAFLDEFWSERLEALRREVETEHRRRTYDGDRKR
jgi:DNA-binding transcriptional ArsR family regulator